MNDSITREAVIDRYEGDLAVVFFADDPETPVDIGRKHLPRRKPKEGTYLKIEMKENTIISIEVDQEATAAARKRIQEKLARLRRGDHLLEPPEETP
jgi:hypothetical protein